MIRGYDFPGFWIDDEFNGSMVFKEVSEEPLAFLQRFFGTFVVDDLPSDIGLIGDGIDVLFGIVHWFVAYPQDGDHLACLHDGDHQFAHYLGVAIRHPPFML